MEKLRKITDFSEEIRQVFDAIGDSFVLVDEHENITYVNDAASTLFGYDKSELIGKNLRHFVPGDDYVKILTETSKRRNKEISTYTHSIIRKDGSIRQLQVTVSPRFDNGRYIGTYCIQRDLTDQLIAKSELEESEKRFRNVSDVISDFAISFLVTESGQYTPDWYSGLLPLKDLQDEEDILALDVWLKYCHPEDLQTMQAAIGKIFKEHEPVSFEYRIIKPDKTLIWLEVIANPEVEKTTNQVNRILVAGKNITARKAIEGELHLTKYMVDHAPESIFITSPDARIIYANDFACKLLGYSLEEMLTMYFRDIDQRYTEENSELIWQEIKSLGYLITESRERKKDGTFIDVEVTVNHFEFDNRELAVTFIRDITDKKAAAQNLELMNNIVHQVTIAFTLPDIFKIIRTELGKAFDCSNLYMALSDPALKILKLYYFKDHEVAVETLPYENTLNELVFERQATVVLNQQEIADLVSAGKIKSSTTPVYSWAGIPLESGTDIIGLIANSSFENPNFCSGNQIHLLTQIASQIAQLIQRKQSEDALRQSEVQLRNSNATKDKFFSIIAHDLRGPFNAIIGFSDLLYNDYNHFDESEKISMIKNIHDASLGTFKLLENLLEWSRIQTGRSVPNFEPVDLCTIANTSLTFLKPMAEKKNIKLFSGIHFGTIAFCDENMTTTIIRNLISNAIKFTPFGGDVRIWATIKETQVEITVGDNGVGMPPEIIQKLFLLDNSVKSKGTAGEMGTGLGLILCKEFVELNGGTIEVESEPGKGSKFRFTLPK
jgi:PAS domain S-box-containing protein